MAQPATSAPRTFGILSIIFASLVFASSLFGLLGLGAPALFAHAPPTARPEDAQVVAMLGRIYFTMGVCSAIFAVMSALLLVLGIGQVRYRKWAAAWSPRWAIVALGAVAIMATLIVSTARASAGMVASAANGAPAGMVQQMGTAFGAVYAVMLVVVYAPYPILLLVCFTRERVRAAMTA